MSSNKVYISFDFEGIGGVSSWNETMGNKEFNLLATEQLSAFCKGIHTADPDAEIIIADSHAYGNNIVWEKLPHKVKLIKGYPRKNYMVEGLDETFTHLVLFGYHTSIGGGGMMDHTYSSSSIFEVKVNGEILDESLINAHYAATFGVPLSFVYGDDKTTEFMEEKTPGVLTLKSKHAISRFAGMMYDKHTLLSDLEERGIEIINREGVHLENKDNLECEIILTDSLRSYMASVIPGVYESGNRKISFRAKDFREFYRYLITIVYVCAMAKNIN